jgi:hypothetical protein
MAACHDWHCHKNLAALMSTYCQIPQATRQALTYLLQASLAHGRLRIHSTDDRSSTSAGSHNVLAEAITDVMDDELVLCKRSGRQQLNIITVAQVWSNGWDSVPNKTKDWSLNPWLSVSCCLSHAHDCSQCRRLDHSRARSPYPNRVDVIGTASVLSTMSCRPWTFVTFAVMD